MGRVSLGLLGGFQLRLGGGARVLIPSKKAQALLAYLALQPRQPHFRDKLATLLWSEMAERQARHGLRQALVSLRRVFAKARTRPLLIEGDTVALDRSTVDVDVAAFERLACRATRAALEQAVGLYRGELLEGLSIREAPFDQWLAGERSRLRELALDALTRLLAEQMKSRADEAAIQTASRLLLLDPIQEIGHRALMRLYARQGRRGSALRQYRACVDLLERELGAEPEKETKELYRQILQQWSRPSPTRSSAREKAPEIPRPVPARSGLADVHRPLIARETEMALLLQSLKEAVRGRGHVIVLTGEAGIGKTRLIVELLKESGA